MSKSLTKLVGSTATNSPQVNGGAFTTLANNNSATNVAFGKEIINNEQRYLLQRYFDNERTYSIPIVGKQSITFMGTLAIGATTATLSSAWTQISCTQGVTFSGGDYRICTFINGSTAVKWDSGLQNTATVTASTVGVRDYPIPANVSKIKDVTVTVGQLTFTPKPVQTRTEWDYVNTLPYTSDIPAYYFPYNGTVGIFPIPSTKNNVLTFNYKTKIPDMTFDDYSTGTISSATVGGYTVTGSGTNWNTVGTFPLNTNITFLNLALKINPPYGDGLWYTIQSFQSDTSLTLAQPILNAPNISSATYTIGQLPILQEDFHDMLVYRALMIYFSTVVKDESKFKMYETLYKEKMSNIEEYLGTKSVNVDLEDEIVTKNPNLYIYASN